MPIQPLSAVASILSPASAFKGEKWRGLLMSMISGGTSNALNLFCTQVLGMPIILSTVICLLLFNNILTYTLDILFAKRSFRVRHYQGRPNYEGPIPYGDLATRGAWLLRSFISKQFYRYVITIIIDIFITIVVLRYAIAELDRRKILTDFKYRNVIVAALISIVSFFLYVNVLRFDWAYADDDQPVFNIIVMMWVTIVVMMYAATQLTIMQPSPKP
jgi:hypothetical protein